MSGSQPPTLRERWGSYGSRSPVARWTSRVSFVVGLFIGAVLIVAVVSLVVWLVVAIWRWVL